MQLKMIYSSTNSYFTWTASQFLRQKAVADLLSLAIIQLEKDMFEKIMQTINVAGESIKEQASNISEAAKEKGQQIIDAWVSTLPKLEAYGFKTTYFAFSMSLNPTLEFELTSNTATFPLGRVEAILLENTGSSPTNIVFNAVKTALVMHQKARIDTLDPMSVRIKVRLSPEVKVAFGKPKLE